MFLFILQSQNPVPVWLQILLPVLTALLGLLSGLIVQERRAKLDIRAQKDKERTAVQLNFLDPLLISVKDYCRRLEFIRHEFLVSPEEKTKLYNWFHNIKHPNHPSLVDFAYWCNGEGYFAVSTIYLAAVYFYQVNKVRREFPLSLLNKGEAQRLLDTLAEARAAIGKNYGIFTAIQDSVGDYMSYPERSYATYRNFCEGLYKEEERAWLLNVIDYFRNLRDKKLEEIQGVIDSLNKVVSVVESISGLRGEA